MEYGRILLAAVLFTLPVTWFDNHELIRAENGAFAALRCWLKLRKNTVAALLLGIVGGLLLTVFFSCRWGGDGWYQARILFVYIWMIPVAYYDSRVRRIPNSWILYGMAARGIFWIAEGLAEQVWNAGFSEALGGAVFGGGFFLLGALLKKGGMGMGDVKLYLVLGLFFGWQGVLIIMAVSLAGAAAWGVAGLLSGRLGRGDRLPIGPFAYFGLIMAVFLGFGR